MKLKNTVALVTGAGSGMGMATARLLAQQGARVAVLDVDPQSANSLAKEIKGFPVVCDVSDGLSFSNAYVDLEENWGIPRICVHCAGIIKGGRVVGKEGPHALDVFQRVIEVNLIGTFNVLRIVAYGMSRLDPLPETEERGVMINTASIAAFEGQIGQAAYSASKGGVVSMTLPIARELAQFNIRVMTIAPGLIETPMMANLSEKVQESLMSHLQFPKRLGQPEEFARLAQHIIENQLLNGSVIRLGGAVRLMAK